MVLPTAAAKSWKKLKKEQLFELLVVLDAVFDDARGKILNKKPLLSIREAFVILRREESR